MKARRVKKLDPCGPLTENAARIVRVRLAELRSFADKALPIAKDGREELGQLTPPADLQDTYDAWLDQGDEAIDIVERLREAAADGDEAEIQRIAQDAERADAEANRLAEEIGFEQCGEAGGAAPTS